MSSLEKGEIDLIILINKVKKSIINLALNLFIGCKYLIRQWKAFALLIIAGLVCGFYMQNIDDTKKEAKVLLKVNFDAVNYVYDAVSLINQKIESSDLDFFNNLGFISENLEVSELEILPVIDLQNILNNENFNGNEIRALFENLNFEDDSFITNSFISDYDYHLLKVSFGPKANDQSLNLLIDYINSNPLFNDLKQRKISSINEIINSNLISITQIDNLISAYTNDLGKNKANSELYIDNKDIRPNDLIKTKTELQKENQALMEEKLYSNETAVVINDSSLIVQDKTLKDNKILYYPIMFCLIFIVILLSKHVYNFLNSLEKEAR